MTAGQWLDSKMLNRQLEHIRGHYVLRALQRAALGDVDIRATKAIRETLDIKVGVEAAKPPAPATPGAPGAGYHIIACSAAGVNEANRAIAKLRGWGVPVTTAVADNLADLQTALANAATAHPEARVMVIGNKATSDEIAAADAGKQAALQEQSKNATIVFADNFTPMHPITQKPMQQGVMAENLIMAGACLASIDPKKQSVAELEQEPAAMAALAILRPLRLEEGPLSLTDLNRFRPDPNLQLTNRLALVAQMRFLPAARAVTPNLAGDILAARQVALSV
jgi:hypothetical protein